MKKVRCVEDSVYFGLTKGEEYPLIDIYNNGFQIRDDHGRLCALPKEWFEFVKDEPNKGSDANKGNYEKGETPSYYTGKYKGIKVIDFIYDFELDHNKASAVEYIARSGKKDDEIQDLRKAVNHLNMLIEFKESQNKNFFS